MRFDGPTFARAVLAVMTATGDDKNIGKTYKTISLEQHLRGLRLVATDSRLLLTAYVPDLDHHYDGEPEPAELPEQIHVVADRKGRGRGLMGHVLALAAETDPEAYAPGDIEVRVDFKQEHARTRGSGPVQPTLEGMEPDYATVTVPGRERLNLEIVTDSFPNWRRVAEHQSKRTLGVLLPPEQLEKLARIRKLARGPLEITMGEKTALVQYPESDPHIAGVLVLADPEDPAVYQGDKPPADVDGQQQQPADPDQITIDEAIAAAVTPGTSQPWDDAAHDPIADLEAARDKALEEHPTAAARPLRAVEDPDLLVRAAELTVSTQLGSAAQLQLTLRIGQARASRLMDTLEEIGVVGPADAQSGKSRPVLLKGDQVDQAIAAARGHQA